jgi:hypothetical protein
VCMSPQVVAPCHTSLRPCGGCGAVAGLCQCDPWFTGEYCQYLNLQAPSDMSSGTCGAGFESYHSWGGCVLAQVLDLLRGFRERVPVCVPPCVHVWVE